ncbi:MAG: LysM domain-containing protein, partial [Anaerolineales bacterium]|nr:LysM domain-containing protein [Anaerolineales bacterium]
VIRVNDVLLTGNAIGNNAMSSIRVGPHTAVYVYTLPNFGGTGEFFCCDDSDFMNNTVGHDTVSSIRMYSTAPITVTKISTGIDFWSGTKGHVGLILTAELESLVASGSGGTVTLQHDFVDSVQSITVTYNGSGDYVVSSTNLDGSAGEMAHFHYEGIAETATATPTAAAVVTATATATPVPTAMPQPLSSGSYTVQSGDYLFKIAALYGTSVQALALANDITNTDLIIVGQTLTIP